MASCVGCVQRGLARRNFYYPEDGWVERNSHNMLKLYTEFIGLGDGGQKLASH
jgi:hypothetical protein